MGVVFAFVGKGGVGKTSLAALTVRILLEEYSDKKILAIDADPAVGLSTALGINVTKTVDDVRKNFTKEIEARSKAATKDIMNEAHFNLTDAVIDAGDFAFLAIGRPESAGCYCAVNTFLKEIITQIADDFDYVIIDGEAGIEQINRRVMDNVTELILVSDLSKKGLNVLDSIKEVSNDLNISTSFCRIINRVKSKELAHKYLPKEDIYYILEDEDLAMSDIEGKSLLNLDSNIAAYKALKEVMCERFKKYSYL